MSVGLGKRGARFPPPLRPALGGVVARLATEKPNSNPIAAGKHKASSSGSSSSVKEDESHGDRVAADAPFPLGLQIPWRSSCSCSQRGQEKLGGSSPRAFIPLSCFSTNCSACCFPVQVPCSWPPSHAKNRRPSSSPASPTALQLLEGFFLAASACFAVSCSAFE